MTAFHAIPVSNPGTSEILAVQDLCSGYGKKEILHRVSFHVSNGSIVAMIGPNGSGKSTILRTVFGIVPTWSGSIAFDNVSCLGTSPSSLISRGVVYVPQGNLVFPEMSIKDNLTVSIEGLRRSEIDHRIGVALDLFPSLRERLPERARHLSGGEKQQVALAMALVKKPRILLLDEPSLGLAPNLLNDVFLRLKCINETLGVAMLIVEHKVREIFRIADKVLGLRRGDIVADGIPSEIDERRLKDIFLG